MNPSAHTAHMKIAIVNEDTKSLGRGYYEAVDNLIIKKTESILRLLLSLVIFLKN